MPGLMSSTSDIAKILLLGDQGHGKTGAIAALVAIGYKIRMIDTDNGFKILKSLLTDGKHYPYKSYMEKAGIDPTETGRISYIPIEVPMELKQVEAIVGGKQKKYSALNPEKSDAYSTVLNLLRSWKDEEQDIDLGDINDWESDTVLILDTLSTLAGITKYWVQDMNGRLGLLEDEHGRDSGAAQELMDRLAVKLTQKRIRCNIIASTHIAWVDTTRHFAESPGNRARLGMSVDARGWPQLIGRALGPTFGKRWNDVFIVRRTDRGERNIFTAPTSNVDAKNSVWLEESYSLTTGLAEIFSALRYKDPPTDFINHITEWNNSQNSNSGAGAKRPAESRTLGNFGNRAAFGSRR